MLSVLVDTNFLIYMLAGNPAVQPFRNHQLYTSVIAEIEVFGKPGLSAAEKTLIEKLLKFVEVLPLTVGVKEKAIELRQQVRMKTPDAIIAATAIVKGIPLVSADSGFTKLSSTLDFILIEPS